MQRFPSCVSGQGALTTEQRVGGKQQAIKDGQVTISPVRFSLASAFGALESPRGVEDVDQLIQEAKDDKAAHTVERLHEV